MAETIQRFSLQVEGQVQGVGFRPWVFRLASERQLSGFVRNSAAGVVIEAQGASHNIEAFISAIERHLGAPPLAAISGIKRTEIAVRISAENGFAIVQSDTSGQISTNVTPDTAVCEDCLRELRTPGYFRQNYPFITCTNCGPRYTIIKSVPYDRPATTMSSFTMCPRCAAEYESPSNRRFHAQPVACGDCGPHLSLVDGSGAPAAEGDADVLACVARLLREGKILAIKGIGGFHLAVDACNDEAVRQLRSRKHRECKPFAMMAKLEVIRSCAEIPPLAHSILCSPQSPIVLLSKKPSAPVAQSVAPGTNTFGFMLPYSPVHHLLFDELGKISSPAILVMTSGNLAEQPLVHRNEEALAKLSRIADFFVMNDRDIYRQLDDSVVHLIGDIPVPLRRARGYVPAPVFSHRDIDTAILAAGSDLKNTFCLARGNQYIVSEHIGDLEDADVLRHYRRSIRHFSELYGFAPSVVAADLHPGYFSSQYAASLEGVTVMPIQHHWAHIASVLAENDVTGRVIGIAADGTGYGTDGAVWGCECLIASLQSFERFAHLKYFPLAGGDKAAKEAIRPLVALMDQAFGGQLRLQEYSWLTHGIEPDEDKLALVLEQLHRGVNAAQTSSLGRVFDAVAAAVGLGSVNRFEAELPIALEAVADVTCQEKYVFEIVQDKPLQLDLAPAIRSILNDVRQGAEASIISARFHNTLVGAFAALAEHACRATGLRVVALSGGVFCNRLLASRTIEVLNKSGFEVLCNTVVPANDGGLSLGQAAIAAECFRM